MIHTITITIDTDDGKLTKRPQIRCASEADAEVSMETKRLIGSTISAVHDLINDLYPETPEEAEQKERAHQSVQRYKAARYAIGHRAEMITGDELMGWASLEKIVAANPEAVEQATAKPSLIGWFVGQVMKDTGGGLNPEIVQSVVKAKFGIPHEPLFAPAKYA
ncbi:hypothetical protein CN157_09345 [Sinorhizobium meliloti]|nr:hypothetical protein CN157_09345 [Sinorhizobium meliloti]RVQ76363.1 hypothetical protein CN061_13870 [Sinorhizobium meliloti]